MKLSSFGYKMTTTRLTMKPARFAKLWDWKRFPALVYLVVSLVVLWQILLPGYILTLHVWFTPNINISDWFYGLETQVSAGLPFFLVLKGTSLILPTWIMQKVSLFLILFLAGCSAHRLCPSQDKLGKYFAGLIYMLNPFVYVRFMVGDWLLLLGYALAPFAIKAMIDFFDKQSLRKTLVIALLITLVGVFSLHILMLVLLVFLLLVIFKLVQNRRNFSGFMRVVCRTGVALGAFLLLNIYWILPIFTAKATILSQFSYEDLFVFTARTWGTGFSALFSIASMHGYWRGGYHYVSDILPGWYLIYIFILFLAVYGFIARYGDREIGRPIKALAIAAAISLVLGTGVSIAYFSDFFRFLFDNVFFFRGFRDSQKFVALLALAYSYLGGIGVGVLSQQIGEAVNRRLKIGIATVCALALICPFMYSANMLGGFNGELKVKEYPVEWYEVNQYLNQQEGDFNVLFFPWHKLMTFSWSERRIGNPADRFFDKPVIQGKNIEIGGIETQSTEPTQHYIHFLLEHKDDIRNFGELIAPINARYVMLAKEVDYRKYDFLFAQDDMRVVLENQKMVLFENLHETAEFYGANKIYRIADWEELLEVVGGEERDIMEAVYLLGGGGDIGQASGFHPLESTRVSAVKYLVEPSQSQFVIFPVSYDDTWVLSGVKPLSNLGLTNAFEVTGGEPQSLCYQRFRILSASYAVSMACLILLLVLVLLPRRRPLP